MTTRAPMQEHLFAAISGWPMLVFLPLIIIGLPIMAAVLGFEGPAQIVPIILVEIPLIICLFGFFIVNPNTSRVLVLFGKYKGSVRTDGFYWTNPFTIRKKVSLRAHNIASEKIKVNDLAGNPIEIGAVVVWQVHSTAQALFDVEDYRQYVDVQIESALRELAKAHPYDENAGPGDVPTLRGDTEVVTEKLQREIAKRLERAGIEVLEARISHLAYAPEIASAMLQRQQAQAIIAAREKIVEGAVGMVEHALEDLAAKNVLELDDERKATLVGNLLVVLCGHAPATPVLNTGSLYT